MNQPLLRVSHFTSTGFVFCLRLSFFLGAVVLGCSVMPAYAQSVVATEKWVPGRLLVQPRPGLPESEFAKILKPHGGMQVGKIDQINVRIIQVQVGSEKAIEALLKHNKHLKFAERDMILKSEMTANDSLYASEWHLAKIGVPTAWDSSQGAKITVAILDSGVDGTHPDLATKMVAGWNFYDNNSVTSDVYGHGTKVAGAAAAITNNSIGVASVAPGALIMPIRVTDTSGMGYLGLMASGVTWAADRGARVANLSFSAAGGYSTLQTAAQYMKNKGGVVVTAAGNDYTAITFAPSDTNIVVSATDMNDQKAAWSNYGQFVDIAAPGTSIWTTVKGGTYGSVAGTSFATPVTAGVVALMMAANPTLGAADVEKALFSTALDLGTAGFDTYYGNGRINAAAAVSAALAAVPSDSAAPSVSISSPTASSKVSGLVAIDVAASDNVAVGRVDLMLGSTKIASDTTGPYGFSWDSTTVADGNVTLTAYAYDTAGNYSSKAVTVSVANATTGTTPPPGADTTLPVPKIANPAAGSKLGNSVTISGSATDNVGVTKLQLAIDGKLVATVSGGSLSYSWNTRKVTSGSHTILLLATDAAGNTASTSISVSK